MKSEFIESYDTLEDMTPGDVATSKDRSGLFVCGLALSPCDGESNVKVILELNSLYSQYTDHNMQQPIKILKGGDKFIVTR